MSLPSWRETEEIGCQSMVIRKANIKSDCDGYRRNVHTPQSVW